MRISQSLGLSIGCRLTIVASIQWLVWLVGMCAYAQVAKSSDDIQIALTGDSIINQRLLVFSDPSTIGLYRTIREADVGFTNVETVVADRSMSGSAQSGGLYQCAPSWVLDELRGIGMNLFSTANNHANDFGIEGIRSTIKAMDDRALIHTGTGENLALARAPGYLDTGKGRVALLAVASSMTQGSQAGEQRPDVVGRPGLNPLRFSVTYTVDQQTFSTLKTVAKMTAHDSANQIADIPQPAGGGHKPESVNVGGLTFEVGNVAGIRSEPDKSDLDALIASVHNASRQAKWVIVSSHTHESGSSGDDTPPDFLITAAHAAIDAGADIFVAHGPHILRGIEIYHGKPIFYSLGDFIFENETMPFQPAEIYSALGLGSTADVADIFDERSQMDTRGFPIQKEAWESVVANVLFDHEHVLTGLTLIPISLGFKQPRYERGRPRLASLEQSQSIVNSIANLSKAFGTHIVFQNGRGVVLMDEPAKSNE